MGRRVLITGLGTFWGGRVAQALERDPSIDVIIGLVYGSSYEDPTWFKEETPRSSLPRTRVERSLIEVEGYLRDFAEDNPHVTVTLLRFANVLGPDIETSLSKALSMPLAPQILG